MGNLADKLARAAGGGPRMSDFDGQVVQVLGIETEASPFQKGEQSVKATILHPETGEEVWFYTTPTAGRQLQAIEEDLPAELKVVSFPGQFGKTGYKFEEPDA